MNNYHYRRGGSDVVYLEHASIFAERGWDTAYFAMKHPKNYPTSWSRFFVEEIEFGRQYGLVDKIAMAGKVIYSNEAITRLGRLLDEFPADIVHGHIVHHHLSPAVYRLTHSRGIPTVMTAHDLKLACPAYKMMNSKGLCERCRNGNVAHLLLNRCIHGSLAISSVIFVETVTHRLLDTYRKCLDRIIVPSRFLENKLIEWGWSAERLVHVPNYIDAERIVPASGAGDYVLYLGRLAQEKGVGTLVKAARKANLRTVVAGTGPLDGELRALAESIDSPVELVGYQSGEALATLIRDARVLVLPSEGYENAPISILEAYAYGKPVIGTRIGGIPELIEEDTTGLTAEPGDVESLAACMSRMAALPDSIVTDMGMAGRRRVDRDHSVAGYYDRICDVYRGVGVPIEQ